MNDRPPRDERREGDPRDPRDERREGDPRDERDAWRVGDQRDRRVRRGPLSLTILIVALFLVDFFWSGHIASTAAAGRALIQTQSIAANHKAIAAEQKAITAACDFWYPLTSLPITVMPPMTKPNVISVQIIAGARESYAGQCAGRAPLPPPALSLIKWAKFYHISVTM